MKNINENISYTGQHILEILQAQNSGCPPKMLMKVQTGAVILGHSLVSYALKALKM